ncbi:MAG: hypothetical protein KJP04_08995 [Arenicella sp.]|nr:hypothetical protein [Arenicella sp.]
MRVVCLVPSLTETLLECGVNVVGRTRFCIHPAAQVRSIPIVGGTKGVDWSRCNDLNPDLVVMDREENQKAMAEECPCAWHATHVTSVDNVGSELHRLAEAVSSARLANHGNDWDELAERPQKTLSAPAQLPGLMQIVSEPAANYRKLEYIIWRNPWMAVGTDTFIHSMLEKLGAAAFLKQHQQRYPVLDEGAMTDPETFYLFSSEPYPFGKHISQLRSSGLQGALVDGECYSWFGIRSYHFLKNNIESPQ